MTDLPSTPDNSDSPLFASASGIRELLNSALTPEILLQAARQVPDEISDLFVTALKNSEFFTEESLESLLCTVF